jgi:triacylglycerol lipase
MSPPSRSRRAVALFLLVGLLGCTSAEQVRRDRCASLNDDLAQCLGTEVARLDCTAASEGDISRLQGAVDGLGCGIVAAALPLDGDPRAAACRAVGVGCVASTTPAPERTPARYPVVLVNGLDASPLFRYSDRIVRTMREAGGHAVFLATLPPYEPPHVRAPLLWRRVKEILVATGAEKVNLVCHSLGGLDCRYLASPGGLRWDLPDEASAMSRAIASVTTIGTAHRGTRVADVALGLATDHARDETIARLAAIAGDWFSPRTIDEDKHVRDALVALSEANAAAFNLDTPDDPAVLYQSWAGVSRPFGVAPPGHDERMVELCDAPGTPRFLRHDHMALPLSAFVDVIGGEGDAEPSDGFVRVDSAKWGAFRGCIPADHMEQLGQKNLPDANVQTGFDVARFYANVAGDLARRGL